MDGEEIIIVSGSESSEIEIVSVSSDEAETIAKSEAGNPNIDRSLHSRKVEKGAGKKVKNGVRLKTENGVTPIPSTSANTANMTCLREKTSIPSDTVRHKHSYKNKTWSQVKKEKEDRRCLPPACKKARLNLPDVAPHCTNKLSRPIHISDDEDDFSDELPDLDQRQKTPEHQPSYPVAPVVVSSPITLSSDDDTSINRLGIFASLSFTSGGKGERKMSDASSASSVGDNSDKKAKKGLGNKLLLTKIAKDKMALVIGNFLKQNKGDTRPQSPSAFSDVSSSSSKRSSSVGSRHFLDVILETNERSRSQSPVPSLSDVSESSQIEIEDSEDEDNEDKDDEDNATDDEDNDDNDDGDEDDDYQPPDSECSDNDSLAEKKSDKSKIPIPKKARVVNIESRAPYPPHSGIKRYFPSKPINSFEKISTEGRSCSLISYQSQFVCEEDELAASLTHLHVNTIEAAFEEGEKFIEYGLALVTDFSSRLKPTEHIVRGIIEKSLLSKTSISVSYKAFKLLSVVWQKYPSSIYIDWDVFVHVLGNLSLEMGLSVPPTESVVKGSLYLQLVVQALETDLYKRNLHNLTQIRRALAYRFLSVDTAYSNLKQIVYWVGCIITSQYKNTTNPRRVDDGHPKQQLSHYGAGYVPKVLPNLQKLLHLGIQVSRITVDAAKRLASELVRTYIYLSDIQQKKSLLQTMSSDLLRFKMTQKILEEYCDGTSLCCEDFPVSLRQVVEAYYFASPPRSLVTPPQSPSDDEGMEASVSRDHQYSATSCEELAMLIYNNTQSYLQCAQTTEYEPLAQQSGRKSKKDFSFISERDLQKLHDAVDELHGHMLQLTVELNSATHTYLFMMQCLSNLH